MFVRQLGGDELGVAIDAHQQVVEVVPDTARDLREAVEALRPASVLLEAPRLALRVVVDRGYRDEQA
jgi:hypothetical protein